MKYILLLFHSLVFFLNVSGQEKNISVYIKLDDGNPIEGTSITIYADTAFLNPIYNSILSGNLFIYPLPDSLECVYLNISNIGYHAFQRKVCHNTANQNNPDTITLYNKMIELKEVTVNNIKKTKIGITGNLAEIIPGKAFQQKGGMYATNIISNIPDVFITRNEITIRGRQTQQIYLHTDSNAIGLRISRIKLQTIQSSNIEKIIVFYAEAEIHVYLKKIQQSGYTIENELKGILGRRFSSNNIPTFTLHKKNTSIWFSPSIGLLNERTSATGGYTAQTANAVQENLYLKGAETSNNRQFNNYIMIEQKIKPNNTVGLQMDFNASDNKSFGETSSLAKESHNAGTSNNTGSFNIISPSLYFKKVLDSGRFSISFNTGFTQSLQRRDLQSFFTYVVNNQSTDGKQFLIQNNLTNAINSELNISKTLGPATKLNLRVLQSNIMANSNTNFLVNLITQTQPDSSFRNYLSEKQLTGILGINSILFKKLPIDIKLNSTNYKYTFKDNDNKILFQNNSFIVLPSFNISIPVTTKKYISLFTNASMRPADMRNQIFNNRSSDGFVINENNYSLKPAITYQTGMSFSPVNELFTSIYWMKTNDNIVSYPLFSGNNFVGNRLFNISAINQLSLSVAYSHTFFDKLYISTNLNSNYNTWINKKEALPLSFSYFAYIFNHSLYYWASKNWSFNYTFLLSSRQNLSDIIILNAWSQFDLGISKKFSSNWSFFFNASNIFNSYYPLITSTDTNILFRSKGNFDMRRIEIGINYSIKKGYQKTEKKGKIMDRFNNRLKIN